MIRAIARRHRRRDEADMNITAFMNLMVVLVPFLLISAVFSRLTILQLNLPSSATVNEPPQVLQLEVIVRKNEIQVADRGSGLLKSLPNTPQGYDFAGLSDYMQEVKAKFPAKTDATVLLEPDTAYDTVVQVMDAVRAFVIKEGTKSTQAELFPDISIGDAPA
jgi:biopolymer transport protein ExbD